MSVSFFPTNISSTIHQGCSALPQQSQTHLLQQLEAVCRQPGLEQLFQTGFARVSATQVQSTRIEFGQPGQIPQPGQLLSLQQTSFSHSSGLGLGRMNFAHALQHSLMQQAGMIPNALSWLQGAGNALEGIGARAFGGAGGCFGSFAHQMSALANLQAVLQSQLGLGYLAHLGRLNPGMSSTTTAQGRAASFPPAGKSAFLASLNNGAQNAKRLNVSGTHDVNTINKAIGQLGTAEPKIAAAQPGEKPAPGKLVLSQEQVSAIRNAPDQSSAEALVRQYVGQQTGQKPGTANMHDKGAIRRDDNRNALNALLGTKVRAGVEKNSGSSLVMNEIVSDVAKSIRGGSFGTTQVTHDYAASAIGGGCLGAFNFYEGQRTTAEFANGPTALSIDLNGYKEAANTVGELYSPLIFDLEGQGLKLKNGGLMEVDLDGDGKLEMISELDAHIGLLVFDSKFEPEDGQDYGAGRDMFGNGTDLSHYGIRGPQDDGTFANGFDALRALAEKFDLVRGNKQHLDEADLTLLEREVGLSMRVGGISDGEDQGFRQIGITRINLGNPDGIQAIEQAEEDRYGNRLMRQEGATFVVKGTTRDYCDIWFNIQARADVADFKDDKKEVTTSGLLAMQRRI